MLSVALSVPTSSAAVSDVLSGVTAVSALSTTALSTTAVPVSIPLSIEALVSLPESTLVGVSGSGFSAVAQPTARALTTLRRTRAVRGRFGDTWRA